jgi:hypothetical protein
MQCGRCGVLLKAVETYDFHGKVLCEDCYFYETNPPKACGPTPFPEPSFFGTSSHISPTLDYAFNFISLLQQT